MRKEKKIRTYQRRTKSGKTITVRAHTASYETSEKNKEATKKKGAGEELSSKIKNKIIDYVERATDGEYASGKYTWKDTLAALRHPSESSVRERVEKIYGIRIEGVKKKPYNYYNEGSKKLSRIDANGPAPRKASAKTKKPKKLTSAQVHAINALLDKPG